MYVCGKCGREIELKKEDPIRCPYCGGKILLKKRQTLVKKVKAR